jgi:RNA polymerase sigma factor (sigma-70 family)
MHLPKNKTDVPPQHSPADVERLIAEHRPRLKSFIYQRVRNREDTEDILQDVFYRFVKTAYTTLHPIEQVAAWLYRVAQNTIINHSTRQREEAWPSYRDTDGEAAMAQDFAEVLSDGDAAASPETEYLRSLVWAELEQALAELPAEQRKVYEWTELEGASMKEVAQATGVPVNTLLSRKHYAVLYLRRRMRELYEEVLGEI